MTLSCPQCQSERIHLNNYAKKTCGAIGTVAGAAVGVAGRISGAEVGAIAGLVAGPAGAALGGIAGAIIGGLFSGAAGCAVGVKLGEVVDDNILNNYHCIDCEYTFSKKSSPADDAQPTSHDHGHGSDNNTA